MADTPQDQNERSSERPDREELKRFDERLRRIETQLAQLIEKDVIVDAAIKVSASAASVSPEELDGDYFGSSAQERHTSSSPVPVQVRRTAQPSAWSTPGVSHTSKSTSPTRNNVVAPAATVIMGMTAAAAFVLAAVYFIKID